jgi:hypothetical protein
MFIKRRVAASAAVIAALAVGAPVASGSAATTPASGPAVGAYSCPLGITDPATGCGPYWRVDPPLRSYPYRLLLGQ